MTQSSESWIKDPSWNSPAQNRPAPGVTSFPNSMNTIEEEPETTELTEEDGNRSEPMTSFSNPMTNNDTLAQANVELYSFPSKNGPGPAGESSVKLQTAREYDTVMIDNTDLYDQQNFADQDTGKNTLYQNVPNKQTKH